MNERGKIVIREVQGDSGFQVRQLLAERIGESRKAPKLRSHGQILPFNKAGRDVIFVRPSVNGLGYNLRRGRNRKAKTQGSNTVFKTLPVAGVNLQRSQSATKGAPETQHLRYA